MQVTGDVTMCVSVKIGAGYRFAGHFLQSEIDHGWTAC